jgi:uncharacterized membrane protein
MTKLALGVLLWSFTHFLPAAFTGFRKTLVARLGENPYKGVFLLLMALAIYLIISAGKPLSPGVYGPPGALWDGPADADRPSCFSRLTPPTTSSASCATLS